MEKENRREAFARWLKEQEKAEATIAKYLHNIGEFERFLDGREISKELALLYRCLAAERYCAQTVNGRLAAVNAWLRFCGREDCCLRSLRVQRRAYVDEKRELSQSEYRRLLQAARRQGKRQLYYIILTIASTGIRISELPYITAESLRRGRAEIRLKGKYRVILLPQALQRELSAYMCRQGITGGSIFCTRNGRPLDRSNICHAMKGICREARVEESKAFPHNLRHLFARSFYQVEKNLPHLADLLGHSSLETTRIYVAASAREHERVLNRMNLVFMDEKKPQNTHSVV